MRIRIAIPTYQRKEKLLRLLKSIKNSDYPKTHITTFIICDNNDSETAEFIKENPICKEDGFNCEIWVNTSQQYVIGSWNNFFQYSMKEEEYDLWDGAMWLVDDVELYPNCITEAVKCMKENYPNRDGVVGLSQKCPGREDYTYKQFGQILIGQEFVERYEEVDYKVCCDQYHHFYQDEELFNYASALGKFKHCPTAVLNHYHPAFIKSEMDSTHPIVRGKLMKEDTKIYNARKAKGLIWGNSWEKV